MNNIVVIAITLFSTFIMTKLWKDDTADNDEHVNELIKKEINKELKNTKDKDELEAKITDRFNNIFKDKIKAYINKIVIPPVPRIIPVKQGTKHTTINHNHFDDPWECKNVFNNPFHKFENNDLKIPRRKKEDRESKIKTSCENRESKIKPSYRETLKRTKKTSKHSDDGNVYKPSYFEALRKKN